MIGYYKKHIYALTNAISAIRAHPERLNNLIEFQRFLIMRILNSENKIDELKDKQSTLKRELRSSRLPKGKSNKVKKKIKFYQRRINQYKWMLFVWKCFGDAAVFVYVDKFAVKPLMYEFGTSKQKQTSGRLAGKEGLAVELTVAFDALVNSVPAILCDLTNCIRHGDICLLDKSDPRVIEVKSSANTNLRVDRQVEAISGLHEYFETDQSNKLFGVPNLKRMGLSDPELNYQSLIAQQISLALENGFQYYSPENGLHIFAISNTKTEELRRIMSSLDRPIVFILNETKNEEAWGSYYPFVLSIDQPNELYAFLKGDVNLIVSIELGVCESLAQEKGLTLNYQESGDYAFEFSEAISGIEEPFRFNLSHHFVGRIAHEFLSLQWVMDFQEHNIRELKVLVAQSDS